MSWFKKIVKNIMKKEASSPEEMTMETLEKLNNREIGDFVAGQIIFDYFQNMLELDPSFGTTNLAANLYNAYEDGSGQEEFYRILETGGEQPLVQPEQVQPEQVQPEQVQPEQVQPEQVQPEQVQPEQVQPEQVVEPMQNNISEPSQTVPVENIQSIPEQPMATNIQPPIEEPPTEEPPIEEPPIEEPPIEEPPIVKIEKIQERAKYVIDEGVTQDGRPMTVKELIPLYVGALKKNVPTFSEEDQDEYIQNLNNIHDRRGKEAVKKYMDYIENHLESELEGSPAIEPDSIEEIHDRARTMAKTGKDVNGNPIVIEDLIPRYINEMSDSVKGFEPYKDAYEKQIFEIYEEDGLDDLIDYFEDLEDHFKNIVNK